MRATRVRVTYKGDQYDLNYYPRPISVGYYDPPESAGVEILSINGDKDAPDKLVLDQNESAELLHDLIRLAEDYIASAEEDYYESLRDEERYERRWRSEGSEL